MKKLILIALLAGAGYWAWTNHPEWFRMSAGQPDSAASRGAQKLTGGNAKEAEQIR
jgi:hypothetical protein